MATALQSSDAMQALSGHTSSDGCPDEPTLARWLAGRAADRADTVEAHVLQCTLCQQYASRLTNGDELLSALSAPPEPQHATDDGIVTGLVDRVRALTSWSHGGPPADLDVAELSRLFMPAEHAGELGRLEGFRVIRLLGTGGLGAVFEAEDETLKRRVALKMLRPGRARQQLDRDRFLREARAVAAVNHDHIIPIHGVGAAAATEGDIPYFTMPLLAGETLEQRLQRLGSLSPAEVRDLGRQLALGLATAHAAGIVHRDIKPANVWLESRGSSADKDAVRVKILDFGLARPLDGSPGETAPGLIVGTPAYMAPEQAAGEAADARSDLFSLGCVLYRCVTGQFPFPGKDTLATLRSLAVETPLPPHHLRTGVPRDLSRLIMRLLDKDPSQRPQSADEVAIALDRMSVAPQRPRRRWLFAAALSAVAAAILAGVIILRIRHPDGKESEIEVPPGKRVTIDSKGQVVVGPLKDKDKKPVGPIIVLPQGPVPLDQLKRENISAIELATAGGGDPKKAPAELVAVLGDSRFKHWHFANRVRYRPDGKLLFSKAADQAIYAWDSASGQLRYLLADRDYQEFTLSPDGRWLATGTKDGKVALHDAATGVCRRELSAHADAVSALAFDDACKLLATGGEDHLVRLHDISSGKVLWKVDVPAPTNLAFSADAKQLRGTGGKPNDRILLHWETSSGKTLLEKQTGLESRWLDPRWLLSVKPRTHELVASDAATGEPRAPLIGHTYTVRCAAANGDGSLFASAAWDFSLRLWRSDGESERVLKLFPDHSVLDLAFSRDGKSIAAADDRFRINQWDVASGEAKFTHDTTCWNNAAAFSPNGRTIFASTTDGRDSRREMNVINTYDAKTMAFESALITDKALFSLAVRGDGQAIATGSATGAVKIWGRDGRLLVPTEGHTGSVACLAWSADGRLLASAGTDHGTKQDRTVTIWNGSTGAVVHALTGYKAPVFALAFHPGNRLLATSCRDGFLRIFDTTTGKNVGTHASQIGSIRFRQHGHSLAFSFDGTRLVCAFGNDVQVFEVTVAADGTLADLREARLLKGHTQPVTSVAFCPDGRTVASCGSDGKIRTWDVDTGKERRSFSIAMPLNPGFADISFSPEGRHLLACHANNTCQIYRLK